MKKLVQSVSVFMAATILLQTAFSWLIVFFLWNQNIHSQKEKMEHSIPIENLIAIDLKKNNYAVRISEKEIKIGEQWFDVIYKTGTELNEVFYCISDKMESEIILSIEKDNQNEQQQGLVSFMKSFSKEYPPTQFSFSDSKKFIRKLTNTELDKDILEGYASVIYSPPDIV